MKVELVQENDKNNITIINDVIEDKIHKKTNNCYFLKQNLNKDKIIIITLLFIIFILLIHLIKLTFELITANDKVESVNDLDLNLINLDLEENITHKSNLSLPNNSNIKVNNYLNNLNNTHEIIMNKSLLFVDLSNGKEEINKTTNNISLNNSFNELKSDNITIKKEIVDI